MKKTLFLILLLPLFFACSSDDNEPNLTGTKWLAKIQFNENKYYWTEIIEFTSKSDCVWTVISNGYGPDYSDDSNQLTDNNDGLIYTEYHLTYSRRNTEILF